MILDPVTNLLSDVVFMLEKMNWPSPREVARALDIAVASGPVAAVNFGPPPIIHVPDHLTGYRREFTIGHEIGHTLTKWRGIDDELLAYYAPECAYSNLEGLCNHIAGLIMVPQPSHDKALRRFGFTPRAMMHLVHEHGVSVPMAMDRVIYDTDSYYRAAVLFKKGHVHDWASTTWIEIEHMQHIPDPQEKFSGMELLPLEGPFVLGTWGE